MPHAGFDSRVRHELLPGVSRDDTAPVMVFESRPVIASARRRAALRDVLDVVLLAAVDALFIRWPHARMPLLGRADTLLILAIVNVVMIAYLYSARTLPRWRARRLASTWSEAERSRFLRF